MDKVTLRVQDRFGMVIEFSSHKPNPEKCIDDRSLFGVTDKDLIEDIKAKPFIVIDDIDVTVTYKGKIYKFTIKAGFTYDGATIPSFVWKIIGQPTEPRLKLASCVHDWMCEHHKDIGYDRQLSTHIFITLCDEFGKFNKVKRVLMGTAIDIFQMLFCGWNKRYILIF